MDFPSTTVPSLSYIENTLLNALSEPISEPISESVSDFERDIVTETKEPELPIVTILQNRLEDLIHQVRINHLDRFALGLLLGVHLPIFSLLLLGYIACFPIFITLQNPIWLVKLQSERFELLIVYCGVLVTCELYSLYCIYKISQWIL